MTSEILRDHRCRIFDRDAFSEAARRMDGVAKPLDGLGIFEDMICRIAGMQGTADVDVSKRIAVMMCADNGVVEEGVSQSSYDVTAKVAASMSKGRSSVCLMAERAGADTLPVDVGIKDISSLEEYNTLTLGDRGHYRLLNRSAGRGSADFALAPALTEEEFEKCFITGADLAHELSRRGYKIICTGEMGIGNTTTSAALTASLLGLKARDAVGRGAGLDDEGLKIKTGVIESAIQRYDLYHASPVHAACCVGGFDIAALAGLFTGGAECGIPVVADGLISAAAALLAYRMDPDVRDFMLPSHMGGEKAMKHIMKELSLIPPITARMKLGEGTGAVMLLPLLDMALAVYNGSASFDDISVEQYRRPAGEEASGDA